MITDLKELKKFLQICRSQGVTEIKFDNIDLKFGDLPKEEIQEINPDAELDELVGLSPIAGVDPMAFYSSPGEP